MWNSDTARRNAAKLKALKAQNPKRNCSPLQEKPGFLWAVRTASLEEEGFASVALNFSMASQAGQAGQDQSLP